ncbi:MAG: hypothetical protein G5663_00085 [Serratia symbiotica]|nr:hypothetical protein [Serratia symbiotica]
MQQVLGSDATNQLAEKLGADPAEACSNIASFCLRWLAPHLGGYSQQVIQVKVKLCSTLTP